jgi:hypothetical protein
MIALHILLFVVGTLLVLAILGSALETVVLPQEGFPRLAQAVFAAVHRLLIHQWSTGSLGMALRTLYAPVALVSLPLVWMTLMAISFTCMFWGTGSLSLQRAFEISGSSLTTLGFAEPDTTARIWLAFIEATIGLGLVALLISYLPTIYSAYNGREKGLVRLRPITGTRPTATEFVQTLHRIGSLDSLDFWQTQGDWILDVEQTHTAFPILSYFPDTHRDHSWVATIGVLLDASALLLSVSETETSKVYEDFEKGPLLVFVYGMPAFVRIARAANVPLPEPPGFSDLTPHLTEPAPPICISRDEYLEAMADLAPIVALPRGREEDGWRRFAWLRSSYEPALRAMAGLTLAYPAPWTTDRPALVGKPRFLRRRPLSVDWSVSIPGSAQPTPTGG